MVPEDVLGRHGTLGERGGGEMMKKTNDTKEESRGLRSRGVINTPGSISTHIFPVKFSLLIYLYNRYHLPGTQCNLLDPLDTHPASVLSSISPPIP